MINLSSFTPYQQEVLLDWMAGSKTVIYDMNYTNNQPDINKEYYLEGAVYYDMFMQPLGYYGEEMWGVWVEECLVSSRSDIRWYLQRKDHITSVPFVHRILTHAYRRNATYELVAGKEIHHVVPRNGMIALMFGDRISTPMLTNGTFTETPFNFLKQDDEWMQENHLLQALTREDHYVESCNQRSYPYSEDVRLNIRARCEGYPKNPYYRFEDGQSYVNRRYLFGEPRYSQIDWW